MNTQTAIKIIEDNANSDNDSLLDYTHEREMFDEKSFWMFYNAIRQLGFEYSVGNMLNRKITTKLIKGYQYFLLQIGFHFDKKDIYKMKNLPKNYTEYCGRLRVAVDAYLTGNPISDETEIFLNEELENSLKSN